MEYSILVITFLDHYSTYAFYAFNDLTVPLPLERFPLPDRQLKIRVPKIDVAPCRLSSAV
jgi:hypothetical protein